MYLKELSDIGINAEIKAEAKKVSKKDKKKEEKEELKEKKTKKNSSVTKMAMLFSNAKDEDKFLEDIDELPMPEESTDLRDVLKDPGTTDPENIEQAELWDTPRAHKEEDLNDIELDEEEDADEFGDPGEFMPSEETPIEMADEDKASRLALIRERHQAYLDKLHQPMHDEDEENETLEEELAETPEDELLEQKELEEGELPPEFEDEE